MNDYISSLNEPQRDAVINSDGPMMIIAGAGSGKTRVLTYRIAHLLEKGVEPFQILSLTFTNKAAREMRERIEAIVGNEARNIWMGTFHSIFAKILRFEADRLGYQSNFTIYDADDSKSVLKAIIKELQLDDKIYKPNNILSRISNAKNNLISWKKYQNSPQLMLEDDASGKPKFAEIYKQYALRCFKANAMDFDDLLYNTNVLFSNPANSDVLNKYQHKFKYVMIDEFQDTNHSQYAITRKLSAVHQNICVVGDDAQSIYAFRGANIQNILNFEKDYSGLKVVKLEQNYRSTQNIVEAANSVIKHNSGQLEKDVWTKNDIGDKLDVIRASSDIEESKLIATSIYEQKMQHGLQNQDFAILYRTNAQSRTLEEALRKINVPYRIVGGLSFYQRKEIKDLIAYLRFIVNPQDLEAFKRIINLPKRGIGNTSVDKVLLAAYEHNISIWDVVCNVEQYFGAVRFANAIDGFATLIRSFQMQLQTKDAYETASAVAKNSGLLRDLYNDKSVEGRVRYDNLQELLNGIKAFVDDSENPDKSLEAYLQQVSLLTTQDQGDDADRVTLMTIHMSKGLEFKNVYLAGMEESLFPSQMMMESRADLEEERRLFYVAITRAESKLTLSYALQRYRFGKLIMSEPSRFLTEIDQKYLNVTTAYGGLDTSPSRSSGFGSSSFDVDSGFSRTGFKASNSGSFDRNNQKRSTSTSGFTKKVVKSAPKPSFTKASPAVAYKGEFTPSNPADLKEGMQVIHKKFGQGQISKMELVAGDPRATVNFQSVGEKVLILTFAKLMIVS